MYDTPRPLRPPRVNMKVHFPSSSLIESPKGNELRLKIFFPYTLNTIDVFEELCMYLCYYLSVFNKNQEWTLPIKTHASLFIFLKIFIYLIKKYFNSITHFLFVFIVFSFSKGAESTLRQRDASPGPA